MKCEKAIILLSGGLDCTCALACVQKMYKIELALTFDYGQAAFDQEAKAACQIAKYYGIEHKIIVLDWLKNLALQKIPKLQINDLQNKNLMEECAKKVWIPNRNGLFVNIAACFADNENNSYDKIIIGANQEEAQTFKDNSNNFIVAVNNSLRNSTNKNVEVVAPFLNKMKNEIIQLGLDNQAPLEYIYSCYKGFSHHCGECESCLRLKRAMSIIESAVGKKLIKKLFEKDEN